MKRLYVFGDSFSDERIITNNKNYINWKGYTPKTFHQIISEQLGLDSHVIAEGGIDNYTIFSSICKNINFLDQSIVIIGWTDIHRFRLYDSTFQTFKPVSPTFGNRRKKGFPYINGVSDSTIEEIFLNRDNINWQDEINDWSLLINKALPNSIIVYWTWSDKIKRETITEETNSKIIDFHYSEKGHLELSNWIIEQIDLGGNTKSPFSKTSIL
jgi:hypothetical protein